MRVQVNWLAAPRNQRRGQKLFTSRRFNCALIWFEWVGWRDPHFASCLLAMSAIWHIADMLNALTRCPLWRQKWTLTNRCLPISIYEYTA